MLSILLVAPFSYSIIPKEFRSLADQAIVNSKTKVPLEEREDTKYPGFYNISGVTFQLKKVLSAPFSKEIKGYAKDRKFIAVAKRKSFNLDEGFAFVNPSTQKVFQMNKLIASDEDVNIYSTNELSIFDIFTKFRYISGKNLNPKVSIDLPLSWDTENDQPELNDVPYFAPMKYGIGAYGSASISCDFGFNSITDISLKIDIDLILKAAAEFVLPNDFEKTFIDEINLYNKTIKIPSLGFSFNFIGIECTLGAFFNFDALIKEIKLKIPYGFDYLKGYQLTGNKYIEITPYSIIDSPWRFEAFNIPEKSGLQDIVTSILSATFEATLELKTYLHFEIDLLGIDTEFNFGVAIPFKATFGFDVVKCLSPYLYGKLNIPIEMFYEFSGIEIFGRQIISDASDSYTILEISPPSFCIGSTSGLKEGSSANIQPVTKDKYLITIDSCVDNDKTSTSIQLVQEVVKSNDEDYVIATRSRPYAIYNTYTTIKDVIMFMDLDNNARLQWYFNYQGIFFTKKTSKYYIDMKTIKFNNNQVGRIGTEIKEVGHFNIDTSVTKCKSANSEKVFTSAYGNSVSIPTNGNYYGVIQFDSKGTPNFNLNAQFYSETMINGFDRTRSVYKSTKDLFEFEIIDFNTNYDGIQFEIQFEIDGENAFEILSNKVNHGTNSAQKLGTLKKYPIKVKNQLKIHYKVERDGLFNTDTKGTITIPASNIANNVDKVYKSSLHEDRDRDFLRYRFNTFEPKVAVTGISVGIDTIITTYHEELINNKKASIRISFDENCQYKIVRIVPDKSIKLKINEKYAIYAPGIHALSKTAIQINSNTFYDSIKNTNAIDILIRREGTKKEAFNIELLIFKFAHPKNINIVPKGDSIYFQEQYVPTGFVIPTYQGQFLITYAFDKNFKFKTYQMQIDESSTIYALEMTSVYKTTVRFAMTYTFIPENTPKLVFDTSYIGDLLAGITGTNDFYIYCNEKWAKALRIGDNEYPVKDGFAKIPIQNDKHGVLNIYPVCASDNGIMCEVTMDLPTSDSIQLFKFPSRDGISITGLGVYSEFINTNNEAHISFFKSYKEMPKIIRGYPSNVEKIKMTVGYVNTPVHTNSYVRYRRLCLYDADDNSIPFSRTYLDSNLDNFMNAAGISPNYNQIADYYLTADDCVDVVADKVVAEKISSFPREACDLNCPIEIISVDDEEESLVISSNIEESTGNSGTDEQTGNSKPGDNEDGQGGSEVKGSNTGLIVCVVVGIIIVIAVAVGAGFFYFKMKRTANEVKEAKSDSNSSDGSEGEV